MIANQRFAFGATFVNEGVLAAGGHIFCNDTLSEDCGNRLIHFQDLETGQKA